MQRVPSISRLVRSMLNARPAWPSMLGSAVLWGACLAHPSPSSVRSKASRPERPSSVVSSRQPPGSKNFLTNLATSSPCSTCQMRSEPSSRSAPSTGPDATPLRTSSQSNLATSAKLLSRPAFRAKFPRRRSRTPLQQSVSRTRASPRPRAAAARPGSPQPAPSSTTQRALCRSSGRSLRVLTSASAAGQTCPPVPVGTMAGRRMSTTSSRTETRGASGPVPML
mmetsp:Transcript_1880/g.6014  ORF Transcript_1880/g.6014 Transcript_1880/m.6014 type:complete len:224 (-) Transcript_1880:142-813(-)